MKRSTNSRMPLLVLIASLYLFLPSAGSAAPEMACETPVHNFGTMDNSRTVNHTFLLENRGDAVLKIGRLRACCGATIKIDSRVIAPGTNTELHVKFSLKGRKGKQRKSFYVASNDPKRPNYQLRLIGTAIAAIDISPRSVRFGEVLPDVSTNRIVNIKCKQDSGFNITNAVCSNKHFAASIRKTGGQDHRLEVSTVPVLEIGITRGRVLLHTDKDDLKPLSIRVSAKVSSDILVVPSKILLTEPEHPSKRVSRYLAIRSRRHEKFKIISVTPPVPEMKVRYAPMGKHGYRIRLHDFVPRSELDGKELVITTDHSEAARITVPVSVTGTGK